MVLTWLLVLAVGGPWPFLQSVAWVKMLVAFSRTDSIGAAIVKTFNGRNQCELCRFVAKGKKADQKDTAVQNAKVKIDFFLVSNPAFELQERSLDFTEFSARQFPAITFSPPTPPPRLA
jgi:hypothetical protein